MDNKDVLVLGATNIPWTLDSAIRRRYKLFVSWVSCGILMCRILVIWPKNLQYGTLILLWQAQYSFVYKSFQVQVILVAYLIVCHLNCYFFSQNRF